MEKNNRYFISFIISIFVYGVFVISFLSLASSIKSPKIQIKEPQSVTISIISNQPVEKQQEKKSTKPQNILPPKIEKPIEDAKTPLQNQISKIIETVKKEEEKKEEKREEKKEEKKEEKREDKKQLTQEISKKIESKESKESKSEPIVQSKQQASQLVTQSSTHHENQKQINNTDEINKKNRYFSLLKQAIDSHKYYPQNALRRAIEADVEVKFTISSSGELISILAINGNKVFQASVKEAIESTFPFAPPKNLFNENTTLTLVISYKIQD